MPHAVIEGAERDRDEYRRFGRRVLMLIALGFLAVIAAGVSAALVMKRAQDQAELIDHTYRVEREVAAISTSLERMRSIRRGLALGLANATPTAFEAAAGEMTRAIRNVATLTVDNPRQQARIAGLRALSQRVTAMMRQSVSRVGGRVDQPEIARQTTAAALERLVRDMLAEERRLLVLRDAEQKQSVRSFYAVLGVTGLLLVLVAIGSVLVILRYARDLGRARDVLSALNADLEGAVRERTVDLQRANDEIQRFAYIVSHDLRSPLVNVMGFTAELDAAAGALRQLIVRAESEAPGLVTAEARAAATEDLPEAIGFIRGSTQKMDRLINAILRLSREGRRVVAAERIAVRPLAQSIIDSLAHRTEELGAEIAIGGVLPDIVSDRLALEQILSNIVENALKYLKPGRPGRILIDGRREGARILYRVVDNGRGIDPRDHDRIFDLFRRSGQQDQPGEGIGLAHVRAQAYRLGGTIAVASRLDEGATFTITLPAVFAGDQSVQGEAS